MTTKVKPVTLDQAKFAPMFGTWWPHIKPFFDDGRMDKVYGFLKSVSAQGAKIAPASINTFRTFAETDFRELKCVIVCQDPYAKFINDQPIASGVAMDCSITARTQPTLQQFYNGIEQELYNGLNLDYVQNYDLSYLSRQGVLLLNTALTVEKDKPNSHMHIWKEFTQFLFNEVISITGVPVLFLGKEAAKFEPLVSKTNPTFVSSHPVSASYSGQKWDTKGVFQKINDCIYNANKDTVLWLDIDVPF